MPIRRAKAKVFMPAGKHHEAYERRMAEGFRYATFAVSSARCGGVVTGARTLRG
ncbi:MAG: hypothetical protein JHC53_03450 [Thermoleophilia bacterium]|nr:hypothetical protein [Thermoleophilia bacterium]